MGCCQFGVLMNKAAMNICVQDLVWTYILISLGYVPRSGIARSSGKYMFNFVRKLLNCSRVAVPFCICTSDG